MKTLKVIHVETRKDKNDNPYKYIQVSTASRAKIKNDLGEDEIVEVQPKVSAFNAYPESYLLDNNGKPLSQFGHNFEVGMSTPGDIVTREIERRFIPSSNGTGKHTIYNDQNQPVNGNWVDTSSVIVFGNTDDKEDFELKIKAAFKARDFVLKGVQMTAEPVMVSDTPSVQTKISALAGKDDEIVQDHKPQEKVVNPELKKETAKVMREQGDPNQVGENDGAKTENRSAGGNTGGTSKDR